MPALLDPTPSTRREGGPAPLRRKRVQPTAAPSPVRNKIIGRLLIFATVVLLIDSLVGNKGLMERLQARQQYAEAEASLNALKGKNTALREYARRLKEDASAIEAIAREELGLTREGELLFIVRDAKTQSN
ncbi:MAG: septum formation initiator family protein [Vicinamibacterales bacterium]